MEKTSHILIQADLVIHGLDNCSFSNTVYGPKIRVKLLITRKRHNFKQQSLVLLYAVRNVKIREKPVMFYQGTHNLLTLKVIDFLKMTKKNLIRN